MSSARERSSKASRGNQPSSAAQRQDKRPRRQPDAQPQAPPARGAQRRGPSTRGEQRQAATEGSAQRQARSNRRDAPSSRGVGPQAPVTRREPRRRGPPGSRGRRRLGSQPQVLARASGWLLLGLLLVGVTALVEPRVLLSAGEPLRGLTFTRPPVTSFVPPEARPDLDLQARVASATTVAAGSVGAVVIDLDTGRTASVQPRRPFPAASLFKLPILAEALRQGLDPNARLEVRPEDWADGSGVLQARVGERLAVRELLRLMVQESDNIAALVLLDALGVEAVNSTMERLGLGGTRLRDHRQGEPGEHVTTPADMARLLELIVSGRLASPTTSEQALALLELRQANAWLAEDLPWWVKIAHKWGDVPGARNDAGLVFSPRGSFVSVVLTEGVPPDQARRAIARTAAAAYDVLGS